MSDAGEVVTKAPQADDLKDGSGWEADVAPPKATAVNLASGQGRGLGQLLFHNVCDWTYTSALRALSEV